MDWVAFDLETTGLGPRARPVEIAGRRYRSDGVVEDFAMLVNPGVTIPSDVIAIHGITDDMVADAPGVEPAMERFFTFAEGAALVAHNAMFDTGVLANNAERLGMPLPASLVYDSVRMARRMLPNLWSYRLSAVVRALNLEHGTFHRAHADAAMVGSMVQRFLGLKSDHLSAFPTEGVGLLGRFNDLWPVSVKSPRPTQSCVIA